MPPLQQSPQYLHRSVRYNKFLGAFAVARIFTGIEVSSVFAVARTSIADRLPPKKCGAFIALTATVSDLGPPSVLWRGRISTLLGGGAALFTSGRSPHCYACLRPRRRSVSWSSEGGLKPPPNQKSPCQLSAAACFYAHCPRRIKCMW